MQFILDNISATIVGSTILLMLVATNHRNMLSSTEATSFYMMSKQSLEFTYTLKHDLQNVSSVVTISETDSTFTFYAQTDPADTTKHQVKYVRSKTGVRDAVNLYQIERFVDNVYAGGSLSTITDWMIEAHNEQGNTIADASDARQIYVRFKMALPIPSTGQIGPAVDHMSWEATFQPKLIQEIAL